MIGDCRVEPAGRPDRSNAVPMELLAVGILVLVLAGFFIAQACHRATKKKSGSAGSLNSDDREDSSLLATSLARDNTGRVSYAATAGEPTLVLVLAVVFKLPPPPFFFSSAGMFGLLLLR